MWLLVGLGNPGDKYEYNRHNIGFLAVDAIADTFGFPAYKKKYQGLMAEGNIEGEKVILLKPQTYMNNSGQSVGEAAKFYKVPLDRIAVFHDELDLVPCKMRVKKGGGSGGHNGIKSIDEHLGADYWFNDNSAFRADLRWIDINSDVELNGQDIGEVEVDPTVVGVSYIRKF